MFERQLTFEQAKANAAHKGNLRFKDKYSTVRRPASTEAHCTHHMHLHTTAQARQQQSRSRVHEDKLPS